jgi:flagellar motor switch protein FliN/FliY
MAPLAWVRKIAHHLKACDEIPLLGKSPSVDLERLASLFASRFGLKTVSLQLEAQTWRTAEEIKEGLGDSILTVPFEAGPLEGRAFWMMSQENVEQLTAWLVNGKSTGKGLRSEALKEGFYRFVLLKITDTLSSCAPFNDFSFVVNEASLLPDTDTFCIDINLRFERRSVWGRLAIERSLLRSWRTHFSKMDLSLPLPKVVQSLPLTAGIHVGKVVLQKEEWQELKQGDFVSLDRGSYNPSKHAGAAYWMLGDLTLFQVKIKHNKIQLLDYANVYEEPTETSMTHPYSDSPSHGEAEKFVAAEPESSVSLQTMPITLNVEIARLKITLEKMLQLAPGNILELPVQPDQPVHLTVNGQVVGKAELVQLGELLGIRILEIG